LVSSKWIVDWLEYVDIEHDQCLTWLITSTPIFS
jgi:hypothetical protein